MRWTPRFATQTLLLQLALVVLTLAVVSFLFVRHTEQNLRTQYGERALAIAQAVATLPSVREAFDDPDPSAELQPLAEAIREAADMSFVVIANGDGIRYSHPNPDRIGEPVSTSPDSALRGESGIFTEQGTLGTSVRGKVPIRDVDRTIIGLVSVGVLVDQVEARAADELPRVLGYTGLALLLGAFGAWLLARRVKRQTLGLEPREIAALYEHREAMLLGIREGVVVLDRDSRVNLMNDEAARLLAADDTWVGRHLTEVVDSERVRQLVAGELSGSDVPVISGDRVLVVNVMTVEVRGHRIGSVLTLRDRTELESLVRELDSARGLADALRAQAHEFSNRLHTVAGLIQLGQTDEALHYIAEESHTHQELAESLNERIGDPALVALLLAKATVASERGVDLRLADDSRIPGRLRSAGDVVIVVGNLLDNALDAATEAGRARGSIDVSVRTEGDTLVVRVRDSGPGIAAERLDDVFREGFTTKEPASTAGRGLGLALVSQVARRYGGTARATNEGGATFVVTLPTMVAADAPESLVTP
jgi:two-component system CitB family sensor kinase